RTNPGALPQAVNDGALLALNRYLRRAKRLERAERLAHNHGGALDVGERMRGREKSGFELGGREVNAALETRLEKTDEFFRVASLRAGEIEHGIAGEKEAEHGTDPVKDPGQFEIAQ